MKTLSILQPWALLIIDGTKTVENRTWPTAYRGRIAIHAGKSKRSFSELVRTVSAADLATIPDWSEYDLGAVIGTVEIVDCLPAADVEGDDAEWAAGPWCWILRKPRRCAARSVVGKLGFFET